MVGQWQFRDGATKLNMHSLSIDTLQFSMIGGPRPDPPAANANAAYFTGTARVKDGTAKWIDTCTFEAWAEDHGEPQVADAFAIYIDCGADGLGLRRRSARHGQPPDPLRSEGLITSTESHKHEDEKGRPPGRPFRVGTTHLASGVRTNRIRAVRTPDS